MSRQRRDWSLIAWCASCVLGICFPGVPGEAARAAEVIELHVAPGGDDAATGQVGSPLATPQGALARLPALAASAPRAQVRVVLHAGVYRLTAPLEIDRAHVPAEGSLTLSAATGETVVVSGGRRLDGWTVETDGTWSLPIADVGSGSWTFRELFVGGERRPRARHPNAGYLRIDRAFDDKRSGFTFVDGDLPRDWTSGGELVFLHDWSVSRIPVREVAHDSRRLTAEFPIGNPSPHYAIDHFEPHPRYFVEGHAAFFDAPGEWLLDERRGVLRYRPRSGETPGGVEVVAPLAEALLRVRGDDSGPVARVHVEGLQFEHCRWALPAGGYAGAQATAHQRRDGTAASGGRTFIPAAIQFERAVDCSLTRGRIAHLGTSGILWGSQTRNCRLEDTVIDDVSGNGVNVGEDSSRLVRGQTWWKAAPDQAATGVRVRHCRIVRCGQLCFGAVAIWAGLARELDISLNEIAEHPYTGISLGWMWNPTPTPAGGHAVTNNHIHHVMQVLSDGGGIYTLGRQPGTRLVGNVIHDVPLNAGRAESNGMFLDEGSDQVEIAGNTIFGVVRSPLRFHKAQQIVVRDNTLVVPDADTPPLRFNSTNPETIQQQANHVVKAEDFDAATVTLPATGPRQVQPAP